MAFSTATPYIRPLTNQEKADSGATHAIIIDHSHLTETTANTVQEFTFPVGNGAMPGRVLGIDMILHEPFEDQSDAAFNTTALIVGYDTDDDEFLTITELNRNGTEVDYKACTADAVVFTSADTVDLRFAAMTGKSLSNIDKGKVEVRFKITQA